MRALATCLALTFLVSLGGAAAHDNAKKQLRGDSYTMTWAPSASYESDAELEIGDGSGHGGSLGWLYFLPLKDTVEVVSYQFDESRTPYESKWPPDDATVTVKSAFLEPNRYSALLHDLAAVASAKLTPIGRNGATMSSIDFWVYARLTTKGRPLLDLNWAGYQGSDSEIEFAKPRAAVRLAREAVKGLSFEDHPQGDEERAWVSAKFDRDMQVFDGREFYWWVRERYIQMVGLVGDKKALPGMKSVLIVDPTGDASEARCIYYAINAVTRLVNVDVRDKPVTEMDIEATRQKVLSLIEAAGRSE